MMTAATPARLYEAANQAAAQAARWSREPGAEALASLRRKDAADLRALAREMLRGSAT